MEKIPHLLDSDFRILNSAVKNMTRKSVSSQLRMLKPDGTLISAQEVNCFFPEICTLYPLLSEVELNIFIEDCECNEIKQVSKYELYRKREKLRNKCTSYPVNLPVKLLRDYAIFLVKFLITVINHCFKDKSFSLSCKQAYVSVFPKMKHPKSCD